MQSKITRIVLLASGPAILGIALAAGPPAVRQPVVLEGRPFPSVAPYQSPAPKPLQELFVVAGKEIGDGSEKHPWNDLQAALRALHPGDRLRVGAGEYPGPYEIGEACRDGKQGQPIEVSFDRRAVILPREAAGGLAIRRSFWRLDGLNAVLPDPSRFGISIEGPARFVEIDRARISGGSGPGVRIGGGVAHITISNTLVSKAKLIAPADSSVGIEIAGGASEILVANNRLGANPAGAIRAGASAAGAGDARDLEIRGNTIRGGGPAAILLDSAVGALILDNTIEDVAAIPEARGIVMEQAKQVTVRSNEFSGLAVGMMVGSTDPKQRSVRAALDVTIDHNHFATRVPGSVAIDIEAGEGIRFVNNTLEGFASGVLVLGRRPALHGVIVANNLLLGVSDTAFVLADPASASLFDFNVISSSVSVYSISVEMGGRKMALAHLLREKTMPHTKFVPSAKILNRDLARISGVEIVNQGTPIANVSFKGSAPDIGAAER